MNASSSSGVIKGGSSGDSKGEKKRLSFLSMMEWHASYSTTSKKDAHGLDIFFATLKYEKKKCAPLSFNLFLLTLFSLSLRFMWAELSYLVDRKR